MAHYLMRIEVTNCPRCGSTNLAIASSTNTVIGCKDCPWNATQEIRDTWPPKLETK